MTAVAPVSDGTQPCAQTDPEAFFPDGGGNPRAAKAVCGGCEFRQPCLDYALATTVSGYPVAGVWGGTTAVERRRLRQADGLGLATVRAERGIERDQRIRELFAAGVARQKIAERLGVSYAIVYSATRPQPEEEVEELLEVPAAPAPEPPLEPVEEPSTGTSAATVHHMPPPQPAPARRWHPAELAAAVRTLTAAGFDPAAIARELGAPVAAVRRARRSA